MNKKILIPTIIAALSILSIVLVLVKNKKAIDKANTTVDRSQVPVSVKVAKVESAALQVNAQYPGLLKPFEEANLTAQTSGIITSLNVELGQQVSKGEIIGKLDSRILEINLKTAEVNLRSATINRDKLTEDYKRAKDLFEHKAGLETTMNNAKNSLDNALISYDNAVNQVNLTRQQIANTNITAPLSGTISAKNVKFGEFVNPGTAIAVITNVRTVKTTVFVDPVTIYQLNLGQEGVISAPVFNGKKLPGKIIFINPKADNNHNYQVDLLITNHQEIDLKCGTDVMVQFNTTEKKNAIQIPKEALVLDREEPFVFVAEGKSAKGRSIKVGTIKHDKVEVLAGLNLGEEVITNGQINLREGSNISVLK